MTANTQRPTFTERVLSMSLSISPGSRSGGVATEADMSEDDLRACLKRAVHSKHASHDTKHGVTMSSQADRQGSRGLYLTLEMVGTIFAGVLTMGPYALGVFLSWAIVRDTVEASASSVLLAVFCTWILASVLWVLVRWTIRGFDARGMTSSAWETALGDASCTLVVGSVALSLVSENHVQGALWGAGVGIVYTAALLAWAKPWHQVAKTPEQREALSRQLGEMTRKALLDDE